MIPPPVGAAPDDVTGASRIVLTIPTERCPVCRNEVVVVGDRAGHVPGSAARDGAQDPQAVLCYRCTRVLTFRAGAGSEEIDSPTGIILGFGGDDDDVVAS